MQQAIIREEWRHLELMEPHKKTLQSFFRTSNATCKLMQLVAVISANMESKKYSKKINFNEK